MQLIEEALKAVDLGSPVRFESLQVYPLLSSLAPNPFPRGEPYICLDEALEQGLAHVTEVSEQGRVPELFFENLAGESILLVDGEELVGARQNRILNVSILVGGKRRIVVPVSCVEQGRWSYRSRNFDSAGRNLYAQARAENMQEVSHSMRASGSRASNQSALWQSIEAKAACLRVSSETSAMADIYEQRGKTLDEYVRAFTPVENQVGAVFAVGGKVRGLELFDSPATFAKFLKKLVWSYALDAIEGTSDEGVTHESVVRFIEDMKRAVAKRYPGVDQAEDLRIESATIAGSALVKDERVIHLAVFNFEGA